MTAFAAKILQRNDVAVICDLNMRTDEHRQKIRTQITNYLLVDVQTTETAQTEADNHEKPHLICRLNKDTAEQCVQHIIKKLEQMSWLAAAGLAEENEKLMQRLKGLGYL